MIRATSAFVTLCLCSVLAIGAQAESLVVLLEGLGGRITSGGIVSLQEELSLIPNTRIPFPLAQHSWRDAVKLIQQQKPETKIVVVGYSDARPDAALFPCVDLSLKFVLGGLGIFGHCR